MGPSAATMAVDDDAAAPVPAPPTAAPPAAAVASVGAAAAVAAGILGVAAEAAGNVATGATATGAAAEAAVRGAAELIVLGGVDEKRVAGKWLRRRRGLWQSAWTGGTGTREGR